jgi:N utilization substance protein B
MLTRRRQARILAMQALCQWDVQGDESTKALAEFLCARQASESDVGKATEIVQKFWAHRQSVDDRIEARATNWDLKRLSPVDRNVMRVALVEWMTDDVPAKVVLDEAIEIGKEYGGAESPRLINGILDKVLKKMNADNPTDR